jgi:tetratricopeptide (TPR) repeat protein
MTMKTRTFFFLIAVLMIPTPGFSADSSVETAWLQLEAEVRKNHPVAEILEKSAELRSFQNWPETTDPALRFYIAVQWLNQRHFGEAYALFDALKTSPIDAKLRRFYAATAALEIGRTEEFQTILAEMERDDPKDPNFLFLKSSELAQRQNFIGATRILDHLIDRDSRNGKYYLQRGILYVYSLSHALALEDFKKAIKTLPREDIPRRQMAYLQAGLIHLKFFGEPKKARPFFKKGVALDPNSELVREVAQRKDL